MFGLDPKAGARVLMEEAEVVAVGAGVSVASDTDPQAITASMIAIQDVIRTLGSLNRRTAAPKPIPPNGTSGHGGSKNLLHIHILSRQRPASTGR